MNIFFSSQTLQQIDGTLAGDMQDALDFRTLRLSHGSSRRKKCRADAGQPLLLDRIRAHVRIVLRARFEVTADTSLAFTDGP